MAVASTGGGTDAATRSWPAVGPAAVGGVAVLIVAIVAAVALTSGAGVAAGSVVDGWPIEGAFTCVDTDPVRPCSVLLPTARAALDLRDPGHAAVVTSELRYEQNFTRRSSILYVAVFKLADGSVKAIGVWYPGVSTRPGTIDYGP